MPEVIMFNKCDNNKPDINCPKCNCAIDIDGACDHQGNLVLSTEFGWCPECKHEFEVEPSYRVTYEIVD